MSYIRRLLINVSVTYRLKKQYYCLTSIIGLWAVALVLGLWYLFSLRLSDLFNVNAPVNGVMDGVLMVLALWLLFVICLFIGVILVAGTFSIYMIITNRFSKKEAFEYVIYSEYPKRWFPEKS